jgi:hypothetical protein
MTTSMRIGAALGLAAAAAIAQVNSNAVRDRGQTRTQPSSQSPGRGRPGTQKPLPPGVLTLNGTLVDAGCTDRSPLNLSQTPETVAASLPAVQPGTPSAAKGITVDAQTLERERADIDPHRVPEMRGRQADPTCAITASTSSLALLLENGRLLNLDEGGNTLGIEAIQSTDSGRALLSGSGPGVKPKATVKGRPSGDRLVTETLDLRQ